MCAAAKVASSVMQVANPGSVGELLLRRVFLPCRLA